MTAIETGSFGAIPFVRVRGAGETIVVISGGDAFVRRFSRASAERSARRIAKLFPRDSNLCILGYGASSSPPFDVARIADDMAAIIRAEFGAVTLAAISFGGFVAARLAAQHPELVRRLILLSTAHRFSDDGRRRIEQQIADAKRGDFQSMAQPFAALFRRRWLNLVMRIAMRSRRRSLAASMNDPHFIVGMLEAALAANSDKHLQRVAAKTLLVAGTRDQFFDEAALRETANAIPDAELVLMKKETHMVAVERTRAVARALRNRIIPREW